MDIYTKPIQVAKELYRYHQERFYSNQLKYNAESLLLSITQELDIICDFFPMRTDSFCGMLLIDKDETSILVNKNLYAPKRLFTLAHELGHFFLHRNERSQFCDELKNLDETALEEEITNKPIDNFEKQANAFASEILLPEHVVRSMLNYKFSFFRIALVTKSSYECTKWRLVRFLRENYFFTNKMAIDFVDEYREFSKTRQQDKSSILKLDYNPNSVDIAKRQFEENKEKLSLLEVE